tara:strand:+ start:414 stop:923 length:510 start_codon:yes stop_codon:yes gene_type:complete
MSTLRVDSIQGQTAGTNRYVVQVVSTTKTDTFSANSAQIQAVTGLSVSITPSNTNNKVLIMADVNASVVDSGRGFLGLYKDGSVLVQGDAAGSRIQAVTQLSGDDSGEALSSTVSFLDSPNTTSAVTYQIYLIGEGSSTQVHVNRSHSDNDGSGRGRFISTITAMEIAQ